MQKKEHVREDWEETNEDEKTLKQVETSSRAVVINNLVCIVCYIYALMNKKYYTKRMYNFLLNYGAHLLFYKTIVGNKHNGGLMLNDIQSRLS